MKNILRLVFWIFISLGVLSLIVGVIPFFNIFGLVPSFLPEETRNSNPLTDSEREITRVELNREEIMLLIAGAAVMVSLLFANLIFGTERLELSLSAVAAFCAFLAALFSIWMGFRAIAIHDLLHQSLPTFRSLA